MNNNKNIEYKNYLIVYSESDEGFYYQNLKTWEVSKIFKNIESVKKIIDKKIN